MTFKDFLLGSSSCRLVFPYFLPSDFQVGSTKNRNQDLFVSSYIYCISGQQGNYSVYITCIYMQMAYIYMYILIDPAMLRCGTVWSHG